MVAKGPGQGPGKVARLGSRLKEGSLSSCGQQEQESGAEQHGETRTDDPPLPARLISGERHLPGGRSKHGAGLRDLQDTRVEGGQDRCAGGGGVYMRVQGVFPHERVIDNGSE